MPNPKFRVSGAFFENERDSGPAFTGFVEIDNVKTYIALWPKTSAAGKNYLQCSEDKAKNKAAPTSPAAEPKSPFKPRATPKTDMDDDIPF